MTETAPQTAPVDLRSTSRRAELQDKEAKPDSYFNLIAYIGSNAIAGEIMAIENYSEMVPLMPDTESKIEAVKQAHEETKHIIMLQRSPSYIISQPLYDPFAKVLHTILPSKMAHFLARWKNILRDMFLYRMSKKKPDNVKNFIKGKINSLRCIYFS